MLSPRITLGVHQKQILTPSLLQLVNVLQLNRLELKEMISQEIENNPVLEDSADGEEVHPDELLPYLANESDQPAQTLLEGAMVDSAKSTEVAEGLMGGADASAERLESAQAVDGIAVDGAPEAPEPPAQNDPFEEIDFGSYFEDYLDPGPMTQEAESSEKPGFETFLSSPVTLCEHLRSQLSYMVLEDEEWDAAEAIIGNLNDDGYLCAPIEELAEIEKIPADLLEEGLKIVQTLEPAGVGARDLQECLLLQLQGMDEQYSTAWYIIRDHLKLLEAKDVAGLTKALNVAPEELDSALGMIRRLDPQPGLRYSGSGVRVVEPDVTITKDGEDYIIQMNDEDIPQLRLNAQYRKMLERDNGATKEVRNYVKERYTSAIQLMKNIEQRKQTILRVCQVIVRRQLEFLAAGIDQLKPMMIKEVAEEIGVHPSTVSRAVAGKYAHTPQGVYELRFFFSEAVQGPSGAATPLLILKRMVKKMIDEEDKRHPLTDEKIAEQLKAQGIHVTRRTVAKYREDMSIPSTHERRVRS